MIDALGTLRFEASITYSDNTWQAWRDSLYALLAGIPACERSRIHAVALCGTSGTSLLCDATGTPLLPALLYSDNRARSQAKRISELAGGQHLAATPTSSLAKLLWLQSQAEARTARYFLHQADWLAFLLHDRPGISDYHNCLKLGFDVERLRYPGWMQSHEMAPLLPQVAEPGETVASIALNVARRFGLPAECIVRAGTTDSIAAFLASRASKAGQAVTSLGSTLVLKLLSEVRVEAVEYGVYSHRFGKNWLAGGASNCGGLVLDRIFGKDRLAALSAGIDPCAGSGLDYYPLPVPGERFPVNDPDLPPRLEPRPADDVLFLQGLLESMARIEAMGYRRLAELGATPVASVMTAGGGAANAAWLKIRSSTIDAPISIAPHTEAAYGCARLALLGNKSLYH